MKFKINKTEEVEVEIPFPSFYRDGSSCYYALLNETESIAVYLNSKSINSTSTCALVGMGEEITAGEFTAQFDAVLEHFQSKKSSFFIPKTQTV